MIGYLKDRYLKESFDNRDSNGVRIKPGMLVRVREGVGQVLLVHDGVPGSHTDRDGVAVALISGAGYWGDNAAYGCNVLTVI